MIRKLSTWVFFGGVALCLAVLWSLSASTWGKDEEYAVTGAQYREVGQGQQRVEAPRLSLTPLKEAQKRQPLEVPREIYDLVRENDVLRLRTRIIPLLGGELIQYTLVRGGSSIKEWDEGWPFFGFAMGVLSFLGGGLIFALYYWLAAVFRLKAPSE